MKKALAAFFARHNFVRYVDIEQTIDALLFDMNAGLRGEKSDEDMIRTFLNPPQLSCAGKNVIVIDAGGTNFRSCLVNFDSLGNPQIDFLEKTVMPGVEKRLSRTEFFDAIAENLEHLKDKSDSIGFCFSYPIQITPDGDGIAMTFSKEVDAPEVVGSKVGACLKDALKERGWKHLKRITLLNDTVAALLAGAATPGAGKNYSSYIGLVLGTGLNAAYIQDELRDVRDFKKQIVVCESGKFSHIVCSDFDNAVDSKTLNPGNFRLEKQCSGAYLGSVALEVLQVAANENLLSEKCASRIAKLDLLPLKEFDNFLHVPFSTASSLGALAAETASSDDYDTLYELLDSVVERSARYAASVLAACAIQSGEGRNATAPVCMLCNGSTYYKTHGIARRVEGFLEEHLTMRRGIYWETVSRENDITLGTAIGGLAR